MGSPLFIVFTRFLTSANTYFASISLSTLSQMSLVYVGNVRIAPIWWLGCVFFLAVAEIMLVRAIVATRVKEYEHHVLMEGYNEADRIKGLTYRVADAEELLRLKKSNRLLLGVGVGIITIELGLNIFYMLNFSDGSPMESFVLPLLFSFTFLGLALNLVEQYRQKQFLEDALDKDWRMNAPAQGRPANFQERTAQTHAARNHWQQASRFEDPSRN